MYVFFQISVQATGYRECTWEVWWKTGDGTEVSDHTVGETGSTYVPAIYIQFVKFTYTYFKNVALEFLLQLYFLWLNDWRHIVLGLCVAPFVCLFVYKH